MEMVLGEPVDDGVEMGWRCKMAAVEGVCRCRAGVVYDSRRGNEW